MLATTPISVSEGKKLIYFLGSGVKKCLSLTNELCVRSTLFPFHITNLQKFGVYSSEKSQLGMSVE